MSIEEPQKEEFTTLAPILREQRCKIGNSFLSAQPDEELTNVDQTTR